MYSQAEKQRIKIVMILSAYVIWREEEEESLRGFADLIRNLSSLCMSQQSPMAGPVTHWYFLDRSWASAAMGMGIDGWDSAIG